MIDILRWLIKLPPQTRMISRVFSFELLIGFQLPTYILLPTGGDMVAQGHSIEKDTIKPEEAAFSYPDEDCDNNVEDTSAVLNGADSTETPCFWGSGRGSNGNSLTVGLEKSYIATQYFDMKSRQAEGLAKTIFDLARFNDTKGKMSIKLLR